MECSTTTPPTAVLLRSDMCTIRCWTKEGPKRRLVATRRLHAAPAYNPRVARQRRDMLQLDGGVRELGILGSGGRPIPPQDHGCRLLEAAWMHRDSGKHYFYSIRDTR
ncbi:unnamed protein product [Diplocarpon coronariae]|nr:xylosidase/arabinosidase [Diplocarpon mali]